MDAQQLAQIDTIKAHQSQTRAQGSNQYSDRGFACLALALESPTLKEQKPLLLEACDAFTNAIRQQRANPEPYIGFAYVLIAIGNFPKAFSYAREAQRINRDHPEVGPILDYLQDKASTKAQTKLATAARPSIQGRMPPPPAPVSKKVDFDAIYDQTELQIVSEIKMLMTGMDIQPVPTGTPKQIALLEKELSRLQQRKAYFDSQLKLIDEEIDISELAVKLKPLEQMLKRFEKALEASKELMAVCAEIAEQDQLTEQVTQETRQTTDAADVPIIEENIEVLLDQADLFADRLDALEAQGHDVSAGVKAYEQLVKHTEELQEALDDLKSQLGLA